VIHFALARTHRKAPEPTNRRRPDYPATESDTQWATFRLYVGESLQATSDQYRAGLLRIYCRTAGQFCDAAESLVCSKKQSYLSSLFQIKGDSQL
jgi:hypothetical protein